MEEMKAIWEIRYLCGGNDEKERGKMCVRSDGTVMERMGRKRW